MNTEIFMKRGGKGFLPFENRPYLRLSIYILFSAVLLYWAYIVGTETFVFWDSVGGDTHHQYIPVYNFFASAIKNGSLSSYTFQYGFGNSIFSMITWISDPFSMIGVLTGVLLGEQYIADSMVYIVILKHLCAGLLCLYFLKGFHFAEKSAIISAYVYAFSGYIPTLGEHYFFAIRPIYFLLLLIVLEKTIVGVHKIKHWIGLVAAVALVTASGVTSAYELLLAAGIYTLFRVIYIYERNIKQILQRLGICLVFVVSGMFLCSFLFFPVLEKIAGSSRLIHPGDYFLLNDFAVVKSSVLKLFSNNLEGAPNSWHGGVAQFAYYSNCFPCFFSVMLVPMTVQFVWRTFAEEKSVKTKIFRLLPIVIVIFAITDQFIAYLFGCFVPTNYHSYVYVFLPLYAVIFADSLDSLWSGKFSRVANYITMLVSLLIIAWGGITTDSKGSNTSLMWMMFSAAMLVFGCFAADIVFLSSNNVPYCSSQNWINRTAYISLTAILTLNLFGENYITTNYQRLSISKAMEHAPLHTMDIVNDIHDLEKDNFFRFETNYYEGRMHGYSYPFLFPIRATAYYDSAINNKVPELYDKLFGSKGGYSNFNNYMTCCTRIANTITEDILGIKYLLLATDFQRNGWERIRDDPERGIALYKNMNLDSAGLLFDSYITQEEADQMSFNDRAIGLAERLIVNTPPADIEDYAVKYTVGEVSNDSGKPVFDVNGATAYMGSVNSWDMSGNTYYISADFLSDGSNITIPLDTEIINDSRKAVQIAFRMKNAGTVKDFMYYDTDNVWKAIPELCPEEDGEETVFTFIIPQTASYLALCVNQPCEINFSVSSRIATASYVNEGVHFDNPDRGSNLTGIVEADKNSLLYLPIPYNKDWNAYVDGEKVEILEANYAFMALPISTGKHSVDLIYTNRMYHQCLKLSFGTGVVLLLFFTGYYIVHHKRKNTSNDEKENE